MTYAVAFTPAARRSFDALPMPVAVAALNLIRGDLSANPRRVGKALLPPLEGQHSARRGEYRIRYRINEPDQVVTILEVKHRRDAYR